MIQNSQQFREECSKTKLQWKKEKSIADVFNKIQIKAKRGCGCIDGCGDGTDGMLESLLEQYDDFKPFFDELEQEQKDEVINKINEFEDGLGDAFAEDRSYFECTAYDICNQYGFFKLLEGFGA